MTIKLHILFLILLFSITSCVTSKTEQTDYARLVRNTTFSDVHRNPKVIANEYFEFEHTTFSYSFARKSFEDAYYRRSAYQGIFVILEDTILLTIQKMLFCDKEVIGQNKISKKDKNAEPEAEEGDKCTYSYYDIEVLRAKGLVDKDEFEMPQKFKIVKAPNSTKIVALDRDKGKFYENKKPMTY